MLALEGITAWLALLAALCGTPWLLTRLLAPRLDLVATTAATGILAVILNLIVPLSLHLAHIPIRADTLALPHLALFLPTLLLVGLTRRWRPPLATRPPAAWLWMLAAFALLVIPCTHLAGVDTYKWQGLAKNVRVEEHLAWVVHPLSLLGFTPRAYPAAQPLLLASIQILGHVGVGAGFYLLSLLTGWTGISLAWVLGRNLFDVNRHVAWFTLFYAFSPLFMRYTHWATGRGLFVALLPLLLIVILRLPSPAALLALPCVWLLLACTHKVGLVAGALLLGSLPALLLLPRSANRRWPLLLITPVVLACIAVSPSFLLPAPVGQALGFVRSALTRFGWMLPAAAIGLVGPRGWLAHPRRRRLVPGMLVSLPLAFGGDPYGALVALPFVAVAATAGLAWLRDTWPRLGRAAFRLAALASAAAAVIIVADRNLNAMEPRVWRAAQALERLDPRGPFMVFAPGRARVHIHAYTSGCPRFLVHPGADTGITLARPPPLHGPWRERLPEWVDFARNLVALDDVEVDWYGVNPRTYFVRIDGEGESPAGPADLLYSQDGIEILKPSDQPLP